MGRRQADRHTAHQMLGEVSRKESIEDLVEDLLGQPGLQEWATCRQAASEKGRDAGEEAAQIWSRHVSQDSRELSASHSSEIQDEAPQTKRRKTLDAADPKTQVLDAGHEERGRDWIESLRSCVRIDKT